MSDPIALVVSGEGMVRLAHYVLAECRHRLGMDPDPICKALTGRDHTEQFVSTLRRRRDWTPLTDGYVPDETQRWLYGVGFDGDDDRCTSTRPY